MNTTKEKIVICLGVWIIVLPFLGFPESWKSVLFVLTGIVLAYVGALLYKRVHVDAQSHSVETEAETFTETS